MYLNFSQKFSVYSFYHARSLPHRSTHSDSGQAQRQPIIFCLPAKFAYFRSSHDEENSLYCLTGNGFHANLCPAQRPALLPRRSRKTRTQPQCRCHTHETQCGIPACAGHRAGNCYPPVSLPAG